MARYTVEDVLDRVWNDSGSEGSISDSDHTTGNSNSDSESEEWSGDSAETSESSDTESGNESEESDNEPVAGNNSNPRRRRVQPRQDQPALQWTPANMERPNKYNCENAFLQYSKSTAYLFTTDQIYRMLLTKRPVSTIFKIDLIFRK